MHGVSGLQSQDVGDVEGHALSVTRTSGLASFPDGSVGTTYYIAALDYTKGDGPIVLSYNNLTFGDGSVLWYKATATTAVEGARASIKGTGIVTGGTGRYAGAKGEVSFTGARILGSVGPAELYYDIVINVRK
jgi:hypothetical protein